MLEPGSSAKTSVGATIKRSIKRMFQFICSFKVAPRKLNLSTLSMLVSFTHRCSLQIVFVASTYPLIQVVMHYMSNQVGYR